MQISSVTVHNFRSIADATLHLYDYTLINGANNTGKSNLIDAIRAFYGHHKFAQGQDCPKYDCDDECWVDIDFFLTEDEHKTLPEKYQRDDRHLRVRRYLKSADKKRKPNLYAFIGNDLADEQFFGTTNVQKGKLGKIIYIPASSRITDHTKTSGPSAWRDILTDICGGLVESSPSYAQLEKDLRAFEGKFLHEETSDERSFSKLESAVNQGIQGWGIKFALGVDTITADEIAKSLIGYSLLDSHLGDAEINEQLYGQGFQRHLIFTLLSLTPKFQASSTDTSKGFNPDLTLLLFEEPEAYLHPAQQNVLYRSLRAISANDSNQVVVSSHSPQFVSYMAKEIPSLARLTRKDGQTIIGQIGETRLSEIFSDNQQINDILSKTRYAATDDDLKNDMEAVKYGVWLDSQRCELFFANLVLMVEGPTERVLINHLLNTGQVSIPEGGVFVLDCMGKFNIHRFMYLLNAFNIKHCILFDVDRHKGNAHAQIRKMIEDNVTSHTGKIRHFGTELEDFLGIDKVDTNRSNRKPQHVMLRLHEGKIPSDRLEAFVALINDLFTWEPFDASQTIL